MPPPGDGGEVDESIAKGAPGHVTDTTGIAYSFACFKLLMWKQFTIAYRSTSGPAAAETSMNVGFKMMLGVLVMGVCVVLANGVEISTQAVMRENDRVKKLGPLTGGFPDANPFQYTTVMCPCDPSDESTATVIAFHEHLQKAENAQLWNVTCVKDTEAMTEFIRGRVANFERVAVAWDFTASKEALAPGVNKKVSYTQQINKTGVMDVMQLESLSDNTASAIEQMMFFQAYSAVFGMEELWYDDLENGEQAMRFAGFSFSYMQHLVETQIIDFKTTFEGGCPEGTVPPLKITLAPFPLPELIDDGSVATIVSTAPLLLCILFSFSVSEVVKELVTEKEKGYHSSLLLSGVESWVHWLSWLFAKMIMEYPVVLLVTVGLKLGGDTAVLPGCDIVLILIANTGFLLSVVAFGLLVSVFFSRAAVASVVGLLLFTALSLPNQGVTAGTENSGLMSALCLSAPIAYSTLMSIAISAEHNVKGRLADPLAWGNFGSADNEWSVAPGFVIFMLYFDAALYYAIGWYFGEIMPREFGVPRKWNFMLKPAYWIPSLANKESATVSDAIPMETLRTMQGGGGAQAKYDEEFGEEEDLQGPADVEVIGMRKVFNTTSGKMVAVDNLSLDFHLNQCTSLLGHNGAGKTTLVRLLTGTYPPTSGEAIFFGTRLSDEPEKIRKLVGVCPQHDILYSHLTVKEHIMFYSVIKGIRMQDIESSVTQIAKEVGLEKKQDAYPTELSGGMKRRLSVAIAIVGDPKVVFLDEPTAGVDPANRRALWDMVNHLKDGRVIVLTTHFMDEADILGDRIAVMARGRMQVVGTSLTLKHAFGIGYTLTIETDSTENDEDIIETVGRHVPESEILVSIEEAEDEALAFALPFESTLSFKALFADLEKNQDKFGLVSFGISTPTLQEVFIQLSIEADRERKEESENEARGIVDLSQYGKRLSAAAARRLSSAAQNRFSNTGAFSQGYVATGSGPKRPASRASVGAIPSNYKSQTKRGGQKERRGSIRAAEAKGRKIRRYTIAANPMMEFKHGIPELIMPEKPQEFNEEDYTENLSDIKAKAQTQSVRTRAEVAWGSGVLKPSILIKLKVLLWKRYLYTKRDPKGFLFQNVAPVISVMIMCIVLLGSDVDPQQYRMDVNCELLNKPWEGIDKAYVMTWDANFAIDITQSNSNEKCECVNRTDFTEINRQTMATAAMDCTVPFELIDIGAPPLNIDVGKASTDPDYRGKTLFRASNDRGTVERITTTTCPSGGWKGRSYSKNQIKPYIASSDLTRWREQFDQALFHSSGDPESAFCAKNTCAAAFLWWGNSATNYDCSVDGAAIAEDAACDANEFRELYLMYNYSYVWNIPAYISLVDSGRLRQLNPELDETHFDLTIAYFFSLDSDLIAVDPTVYLVLMMVLVMAFAMISTFQCATCVEERENHTKEQQFQMGVNPIIYWLSNFIWDMTVYMIPLIGTITIVAVFDVAVYTNNFGAFTLLILLHGLAIAPFSYVTSFLFVNRATAQNIMMIISGFIPLIFVLVYKMVITADTADASVQKLAKPLKYVSFLIPGNVLGLGLYALSENENMANPSCGGQIEGCKIDDVYHEDVLGGPILGFACEILVYSLLVFALEYKKSGDYGDYEKTRIQAGDVAPPICTPKNKIGLFLREVVIENKYFMGFIFLSIGLNMVSILAEFDDGLMEDAEVADILYFANTMFSFIFIVEFGIKTGALGPIGYCRDLFNVFDGMLALFAVVEMVLESTGTLSSARSARGAKGTRAIKAAKIAKISKVLRFARILRLFRVLRFLRVTQTAEVQTSQSSSAYMCKDEEDFVESNSVKAERLRLTGRTTSGKEEDLDLPADMQIVEVDAEAIQALTKSKSFRMDAADTARIVNLHKHYKTRNPAGVTAVEDMCLGIREGEVFGLLGPNGAGKSTVLNTLVGALCPTSGRIDALGYNVTTQNDYLIGRMGFCPQFDALMGLLTGREQLHFYSRIKGIPLEEIEPLIDSLAKEIGLNRNIEQQSQGYSGGNKRKLSAALAMIGGPKLLFMDEPTTGMDPVSAQHLWTVVASWRFADPQRSLIVTTHSMDEANLVCNRIGILVNGRLATVGASQELKSEHGQEFLLEMKVDNLERLVPVKKMLKGMVPDAELLEQYGKQLKYKLPNDENLSLSKLFGRIEERKELLTIVDYSISQTTLEQVFIAFAQHQVQR